MQYIDIPMKTSYKPQVNHACNLMENKNNVLRQDDDLLQSFGTRQAPDTNTIQLMYTSRRWFRETHKNPKKAWEELEQEERKSNHPLLEQNNIPSNNVPLIPLKKLWNNVVDYKSLVGIGRSRQRNPELA
ncbi:hypothetical protein HS088_TW16G00663 [Tripterygium wilfordii]|uniref:Uncharacterized protein n=1 Tax=Tripterygium wilfordii TaxID=458696 RepID=A0A7J7CJI5_TRIWF|nr:hypothetical protein HS088_TW16G00663 [Tripterygium wilfordii]